MILIKISKKVKKFVTTNMDFCFMRKMMRKIVKSCKTLTNDGNNSILIRQIHHGISV